MLKRRVSDYMDIRSALSWLTSQPPVQIKKLEIKNVQKDFRAAFAVTLLSGEKYVLKLAENAFTDREHIKMWQRTSEEYSRLGAYCPKILLPGAGNDKQEYFGHDCFMWAEEYSVYPNVEQFSKDRLTDENGFFTYIDDAVTLNARAAAMYFDHTALPSGYCLFERFSSDDVDCEVYENACQFKAAADKLPARYCARVNRIWKRWQSDFDKLKKLYPQLPRSVFQADINYTNCLVDKNGKFIGLYDFNLSGRDVYLNLLFRELPWVMSPDTHEDKADYEIKCFMRGLRTSAKVYSFSDIEAQAAPLIYRVVRPVYDYFTLIDAGDDDKKITHCLDYSEYVQSASHDFADAMERK